MEKLSFRDVKHDSKSRSTATERKHWKGVTVSSFVAGAIYYFAPRNGIADIFIVLVLVNVAMSLFELGKQLGRESSSYWAGESVAEQQSMIASRPDRERLRDIAVEVTRVEWAIRDYCTRSAGDAKQRCGLETDEWLAELERAEFERVLADDPGRLAIFQKGGRLEGSLR